VTLPQLLSGAVLLTAVFSLPAKAITIDTVPVGNAGNAPDNSGRGGVAYEYRIGTYEVTNAQYAAFLNAKAASDPLGLYNPSMASDPRGGIFRGGSSGSYSYATKPNMGNKPVTFVSWFDAIRFTNWLHNGQGTGGTETGAYTLIGGAVPSNNLSIARSPDAKWFLPNHDEWYKAAYHHPAANGGDVDDYWAFATATNTVPTLATANGVGDIQNPGSNVANYYSGADWNGLDGNPTTVGSAGPSSASYYGTSDQAGNVWEWNETLFGGYRGFRGGSWGDSEVNLAASGLYYYNPTAEAHSIGFRVATIAVPEPGTLLLGVLGLFGLLCWRARRK